MNADLSPSGNLPNRSRSFETIADLIFIGAAALAPVILYIRQLGVYTDDWGLLAFFHDHGDRTVLDHFRRFYSLGITHMRPVQVLYESLLYRFFGTHPFGYHLVNTVVFLGTGWLFYLSLRLILRDRLLALTIPALFLVLPNHSSARFVPFSFMVGLSILFFFLNLYALLKAAQGKSLSLAWMSISIAALIVSGLAYEVALPIVGASLLLVRYCEYQKPVGERLRVRSLAFLLALNILALLSVFVFKALTTTRYSGTGSAWKIVSGAVQVHIYGLGIRLPIVALKSILYYRNPALLVLSALFGLFAFGYFWRIQRSAESATWPIGRACALAFSGVLLFVLGNAIFLVSPVTTGFTATGVENRTAIGASLGLAIMFSGAIMCIGTACKSKMLPALLFALSISTELLIIGTVGSFWAAAAQRQLAVLNSVKRDIPKLPSHTTLLVDGVCPYIGPGIVFHGQDDIAGALRLLYDDPTLGGDLVTPRLEVKEDGIQSRVYQSVRLYPYALELKVYDLRSRTIHTLSDPSSAREYFGIMGPSYDRCPEGRESDGVHIF